MPQPRQVEEFWANHQTLRVHATTTGTGDLPIVLLTGMGSPARHWRQVPSRDLQDIVMPTAPWNGRPLLEPALASFTRVLSYDRGGIGDSQSPTEPRDVDAFCQELLAVLDAAEVPRAVLVGHSLGGLIAFAFARRHPERVAGLVLLDASYPNQFARFAAALPPAEWAWMEVDMAQAETLQERPHWAGLMWQGEDEAAEGILGDVPLAVISRGAMELGEVLQKWGMTVATPQGVAAMDGAWKAMQAAYARTSTRGELVILPGSSHYVHFDAPQVVIDVIERVWRAALETSA